MIVGETQEREDRIRARAYRIWESEGCPDDRAELHWAIAVRIVDDEDSAEHGQVSNRLDAASADSFPASDPPAMTEPTRSIAADPAAAKAGRAGSGRRRRGG